MLNDSTGEGRHPATVEEYGRVDPEHERVADHRVYVPVPAEGFHGTLVSGSRHAGLGEEPRLVDPHVIQTVLGFIHHPHE